MGDPIGPQPKIASDQYHVGWQKLLDGGGAKSRYEGQRNMESATRKSSGGKLESEWQGKTKGKTTHTYGVNGKNDPD